MLFLSAAKLLNSSFFISTVALNYSKYYGFSLLFTFLLTAVAIVLNILLIPPFGMNGAALASLGAYAIYYAIALCLILPKVHVNPFSWAQLKVVALILLLFMLNLLWQRFFASVFVQSVVLMVVESLVRSVVLFFLGIWAMYKWNISTECNNLIDKFLSKIVKKK